ncbi:MAG: ABC transporter ATP-binding protein [Anaerolineales bacterium]|nr:ABC transporter ATP-binding protein [Anaerolineales bacterium]
MEVHDNAVHVQNLTKRFGDFAAVNNVSFSIPKGEIFGLLGPNGAGKTTTIRMLCGIIDSTEGSGCVLGYDINKEPEEIKKRIGYMSQKFSLYNDLTARENMIFYASVYGVPKAERNARVAELIEMSGLAGHENELTHNLSGAWRQRLALACAVVHDPPMLFLDEATAGVDPISRREFWDLIYEMAGKGVSVLATTHYMDEAEYCNMIGMMHRGEMIAYASPDELKDSLEGILFQVECSQPTEALQILDQFSWTSEVSIHGVLLHVIADKANRLKEIQKSLKNAGIEIYRIEESIPSLEDVFITFIEEKRKTGGS